LGDSKKGMVKHLKLKYREMISHLYTEEEMMNEGVNLIISRKFMMIVPLR